METEKKKGLHSGHRNRMRNKYMDKGVDIFEHHEILEMLLFYAIPRKNTNDIAHNLINAFGSISAVFDAPIDDLMKNGLSENAAILVHMIPDLSKAYQNDKFDNEEKIITGENIGDKANRFFNGEKEERLCAIFLDVKGKEKYAGIVFRGNLNVTQALIRNIMSIAANCKAFSVILAHNHPNDCLTPSKADLDVAEEIARALRKISVKLVDYVIMDNEKYITLASTPPFSVLFKDSYYNEG